MHHIEFDLSETKYLIGQHINKIFRTSDFLFKDKKSPFICDITYKLTIEIDDSIFYSFELITRSQSTFLSLIPNDLYHTEHTTNKEFTYESLYPYCEKGIFEVNLLENEYLSIISSIGYITDEDNVKSGFYIEVAGYDKFYVVFSETKINPKVFLTDWQMNIQKNISGIYILEKIYF